MNWNFEMIYIAIAGLLTGFALGVGMANRLIWYLHDEREKWRSESLFLREYVQTPEE